MPFFGSIRIYVLRPCCSSQRNSCEIRRRATGCILYGQTLQKITVERAEGGEGPPPLRGGAPRPSSEKYDSYVKACITGFLSFRSLQIVLRLDFASSTTAPKRARRRRTHKKLKFPPYRGETPASKRTDRRSFAQQATLDFCAAKTTVIGATKNAQGKKCINILRPLVWQISLWHCKYQSYYLCHESNLQSEVGAEM